MNNTLRRFVLCIAAMVGLIVGAGALPAEAANGASDLTWFNATTGVVSSWLLNGSGRVRRRRAGMFC